MKPPYWKVTAVCTRDGEFSKQRKQIVHEGGSGKYTIENLVCPVCFMWARITSFEEVT